MTLTALFVKAPEGPYAPLAIAVEITPTSNASRDFAEWLEEAGYTIDEETGTAFIPKEQMETVFTGLRNRLNTDPTFATGYGYMVQDLVEEVETFEEPLDCYISNCL